MTDPTRPREPIATEMKIRTGAAWSELTATPEDAARVLLEALTSVPKGTVAVIQLMLGPAIPATRVVGQVIDPRSGLLDHLLGTARPADSHLRAAVQHKRQQPGFRVLLRAGVGGASRPLEKGTLVGVVAAIRSLRGPDGEVSAIRGRTGAIDAAMMPLRWMLRLSVGEIVLLLAWPVGSQPLPGIDSGHPRQLPQLHRRTREDAAVFATSTAPATSGVPIGLTIPERMQHLHLLGPTGAGKSTVLLHLILGDIAAGRSVVVLDPQANLIRDILERIPESRRDDVVILDPTQAEPVGFNPLRVPGAPPELIADGILAIFKDLFGSSFGPRTTDIMHASLLTLAHHGRASLVWLPRLLTDDAFRRRITATLDDPVGLEPFWAQYEAMGPALQAQAIAPSLSRLRQLLLRPSLRAVLGQVEPAFTLGDVFAKRRILLVQLNAGLLGPDSAALLGALILSSLWQLTLARAAAPPAQRAPVTVFVDEVQQFLRLPVDLEEALSRSRAMNVAWHLAHQYRRQLTPGMLAALDTNARAKIVFTLNGDADATAKLAPELEPSDFQSLPKHGIYARLPDADGRYWWVSGRTLPPPPRVSDELDLRARSQARYGAAPTPRDLGLDEPSAPEAGPAEPIGRRRREGT